MSKPGQLPVSGNAPGRLQPKAHHTNPLFVALQAALEPDGHLESGELDDLTVLLVVLVEVGSFQTHSWITVCLLSVRG